MTHGIPFPDSLSSKSDKVHCLWPSLPMLRICSIFYVFFPLFETESHILQADLKLLSFLPSYTSQGLGLQACATTLAFLSFNMYSLSNTLMSGYYFCHSTWEIQTHQGLTWIP